MNLLLGILAYYIFVAFSLVQKLWDVRLRNMGKVTNGDLSSKDDDTVKFQTEVSNYISQYSLIGYLLAIYIWYVLQTHAESIERSMAV